MFGKNVAAKLLFFCLSTAIITAIILYSFYFLIPNSSRASTAWRTQSSQEHKTPRSLPTPFRSLQRVAPQRCSNSALNRLAWGFMRQLSNLSNPCAICAPHRAPQVSSMQPIPLPKHAPIASSFSSGKPSSGAKASNTAWQQLKLRLYMTARSRRGKLFIISFCSISCY